MEMGYAISKMALGITLQVELDMNSQKCPLKSKFVLMRGIGSGTNILLDGG